MNKGWRKESHRHALSAKGVSTRQMKANGFSEDVEMLKYLTDNKHLQWTTSDDDILAIIEMIEVQQKDIEYKPVYVSYAAVGHDYLLITSTKEITPKDKEMIMKYHMYARE